MKRTDVGKLLHESTTDLLMNNLNSVPTIRFVSRVDEALEKRGLTQGKLATLCGLRPNTISEIIKGTRSSLTKSHIAAIMIALRITDIREIIDIEFSLETKEQFEQESKDWIENDSIPHEISHLFKKNAESSITTDIRG